MTFHVAVNICTRIQALLLSDILSFCGNAPSQNVLDVSKQAASLLFQNKREVSDE